MDKKRRDKLLTGLGERIRDERERKGYTQTEFANMIGKDQSSLNRLEKGRVNPGYLYLVEISDGLELNLKELLVGIFK